MLNPFRQILFRTIRSSNAIRLSSINAKQSPITANIPKGIWKLGKLNHIAVAVPNIDESSNFFKNILHAESVSGGVQHKEHGVHSVLVDLGNTKIELLLPLDETSPIKDFLEKNHSGGIHHISIEVDHINEAIKDLHRQNIRTLTDHPQIGARGKSVIYLHPDDCGGILIELEQV